MSGDNNEESDGSQKAVTRRDALTGGLALAGATLLPGAVKDRLIGVAQAKVSDGAPKIEFGDAGSDPSNEGVMARNGPDVKVYSGGSLQNLSDIGGAGGALTDSGTDSDGGDVYVFPNAADNLDLQGNGSILNAQSLSTDDVLTNAVQAHYIKPSSGEQKTQTFSYADHGDGAIQAAIDAIPQDEYETDRTAARVMVWPKTEGGGTPSSTTGWQATPRINKRMEFSGLYPATKITSSDSDATVKTVQGPINSDDITIRGVWVDNDGDGAAIKCRTEETHLRYINVDRAGASAIDLNFDDRKSRHIVEHCEIKGGGHSSTDYAIDAKTARQIRLSNIIVQDEYGDGANHPHMSHMVRVAGPATLSNVQIYCDVDDSSNPAQVGLKVFPAEFDGGGFTGEDLITLNGVIVGSTSENSTTARVDTGIEISTRGENGGGSVEGFAIARRCNTSLDISTAEKANLHGYFPNGVNGHSGARLLVNGIGKDSGSAEYPTRSNWQVGDRVFWVDTGDGSGTGVFDALPNGEWYAQRGGTRIQNP